MQNTCSTWFKYWELCVLRNRASFEMLVKANLCVELSCWCGAAPSASGKQCLHGAGGMSDLHSWSPLGFTGFGISCREDEALGNGSASFQNSGFEEGQQISSTPRKFSRKWNIWQHSEKKCIGYVFHASIIRYCRYSFTFPSDPYKLLDEWRLSQVILFWFILVFINN